MRRIRHNDYGALEPPAIGSWRPDKRVTVVIPAYNDQDGLDRTLTALAKQSYPAELTEVVVADDGSTPPLSAPGARVVRVSEGWGRGAARQAGAAAATGDVVHWLDADMILDEEHLEAHMRWHHLLDHAVVIGDTRFVNELGEEGTRTEYTTKTLESTRMLRDAGTSAYLLHTGASSSVSADLLRAVGGVDVTLNMAEDTELGYRLAQAGAVFIPDPAAKGWHVGPSTVMLRAKEVHRHNWSFLGDLIPDLRWLRGHPRRRWRVPYVHVVTEADGYERTRATVDAALAGTLADTAVTITGPWDVLTADRHAALDDPHLDLRLLRNLYASEPRVAFAPAAPASVAPAPFLLRVPAGWAPGADTIAQLVRQAEQESLGLVCAALTETGAGVVAARLERTAAFARAARHQGPADDLVDEMFGTLWVSGTEFGFVTGDDVEPPAGDPAKWRALATKRATEVKELEAEVARLRAEVDNLSQPPPEQPEPAAGPLAALLKHLRKTG
ncbi:glycosyltransferase [Nonomuraea endophytica]|uniref:4,4'-diaponeurosporenoate glycosyltransferase n=1 Tax=Nonomuraea endophytica TaxID=714136 RepID=A0A7W8EIT0_9ACTN|nr:glycosyltransferase [Nonomuraea endophytica]MBB5079962.1 GT2 family glycosyltransferase [Nonomuraea endophytica]